MEVGFFISYTKAPPQPAGTRSKKESALAQNNNGIAELEKRLWAAADQLRANSSLAAQQYSRPVLGQIFLKYADQGFSEAEKQLAGQASGRRRVVGKLDYQSKGVLYLPEKARFTKTMAIEFLNKGPTLCSQLILKSLNKS